MKPADQTAIVAAITSAATDNGFAVTSIRENKWLQECSLTKHGVDWTLSVDTANPGAVLESERLGIQVMRFFKPTIDDALTEVFAAV